MTHPETQCWLSKALTSNVTCYGFAFDKSWVTHPNAFGDWKEWNESARLNSLDFPKALGKVATPTGHS